MSKHKETLLILAAIFLLALALRTVWLSSIPFGFHNDEADVAYVGKFLILHGRDTYGHILPLSFDKFGDFRPIGLFYLAGISQLIFGSGEFAVRFPTAFFGALTSIALFLFVSELFKNQKIGLFSAFALAVLPWHIVLSRAGHEAIVGYFLVIWGFYFLLSFARSKVKKNLIFGLFLIFASYFFYHGIRVLVPLLLLSFVPFWKKTFFAKLSLFFLIVSFIILALPQGHGRLSQLAIYKSPTIAKDLSELPLADRGILKTARIFHNKGVVYTKAVAQAYFQHFSGDFLFVHGGYPQRYIVKDVGVLFLGLGFAAVLGMAWTIRKSGFNFLLLAWLLVSPLPAVLSYEDLPSVTRASFGVIPFAILSGIGVNFLEENLRGVRKKVVFASFVILLSAELVFFFHMYSWHPQPGIFRDEGAKEIVQYIDIQKGGFDMIISTYQSNLPFYFLFFNKIFDSDIRVNLSDINSDFYYKNVVFSRDGCPSHRFERYAGKRVLYVDEPNCERKEGEREVFKVVRQDSTVAFVAVTKAGK